MKYLRFNKKGNLQDIMFILTIFAMFVLLCITVIPIIQKVISNAQDDDDLTVQDKTDLTNMGETFYNGLDVGFLILVIMGFLSVLISAYFIDIHPIMALGGIAFGIILLIGATAIVKTMEYLIEKSPEVFSEFPITNFIINNIFVIIIIFMFLTILVLYGKWRQ